MKIALIGTRGVPANYGGFETCAEEIAVGLVERGHDVTAYCRPGNAPGAPAEFKGVRLVYRDFIDNKHLGTFSHTWNCLRHAMREDFDVLMIFNAGNSPLTLLPRLKGRPFAINVDGLEWKRAKWNRPAKLYYKFAEWAATKLAGRIIADSRAIQDYYLRKYRAPSTFIAYGGRIEKSERPEIVEQYGLESDRYFFSVSRLEAENNADLAVRAFARVDADMKLVIAGGANWDSPYVRALHETRDPRVRFLGPVYAPGHVRELYCHCRAYVHGNEVGGTNPALLGAMGCGACVLALDVPFNVEVVRDAGILYTKDAGDLAEKMRRVIHDPGLAREMGRKALRRIEEAYRWEQVTADYERLFFNLMNDYYREHPECD